jgi:formamidopyrimidine-DNA glycosylase
MMRARYTAHVPELPEVERAARYLAQAATGVPITAARVTHPYVGRHLTRTHLRRLKGRAIARVERRGKHQLVVLDDGSVLHVHFRMTGDWVITPPAEDLPRFARFTLELANGYRVSLDDMRALGTVEWLPAGSQPATSLGPDAVSAAFDGPHLIAALAKRRIPVKLALLDQRVVAGIGNIYAAEALWYARIDPRLPASRLQARQAERLVQAIRKVLARGADGSGRYWKARRPRLNVYDREGRACPRCGTRIERFTQGGRSTYWCPTCQTSRAPRAKRP